MGEAFDENPAGKWNHADHYSKIKDHVYNGVFVEIGNGGTSLSVALANSTNTVIVLVPAGKSQF